MNSGKPDPKNASSRALHWTLAAAALTLALVAVFWIRKLQMEQDIADGGAHKVEHDTLAVLPAALPAVSDSARAPVADEVPATPRPLTSDRASLVVELEETGVIASAPGLRIANRDEPRESGYGLLANRLTLNLAPGTYDVELSDDGWTADEPSFTLAGGELRRVAVSSRRSATVRVVGGMSGKPLAIADAQLDAQEQPGAKVEPLRASLVVSPPASVFAVLGVPSWFTDGRRISTVIVTVQTPSGAKASSLPLPLASFEPSAMVTVRVPEPAILGRITRAADSTTGDAEQDRLAREISVEVLPADQLPTMMFMGPRMAIQMHSMDASPGPDLAFDRANSAGDYQLLLPGPPSAPVHVIAGNDVDLLADSGPLVLPADGTPLRVDLVLPAAGCVSGTIHIGLGTTADGQRARRMSVEHITAQPAAAKELDAVQRKRYGTEGSDVTELGDSAEVPYTIAGLSSGEYEIALELQPEVGFGKAAAARRLLQRVTVHAGATTRADFDAAAPPAGATVRGTVRVPEVLAAAELYVWIEPAEDRADAAPFYERAHVDAGGGFALGDVPPGSYALKAFARGSGARAASAGAALIVGTEDVTLPLIDLAGSELHLRAAGKAAARLYLSDSQRRPCGFVQADDGGDAEFFGLVPGHYHVRSDSGATAEFDIAPGAGIVSVELQAEASR